MSPKRYYDALAYHAGPPRPGKLEIRPTKAMATQLDLSLAYTPGVAAPCLAIAKDASRSWDYTARGNLVAVITNGTAVLGLGDIGPAAAKPVMEGKAVLFKRFADIDVFDLEVDAADPETFITVVKALLKNSGAATDRLPAFDRRLKIASRATITAGRSEAGSAWARPPPTVPRLRTWTSPMLLVASMIRGYRSASNADSRRSR